MGGRKPIPTTLKLLHGNPGRRPINKDEPKPDLEAPDCPDHLDAEARAEWARIVGKLEPLGLVTHLDRAALAGYCVTWARWVEAERKLAELGLLVKTPSGYPIQSPYLAIANQAAKAMREFLTEFGLTPSSRSRVKGSPPKKKDPLEDLIGRPRRGKT